MRGGTLSGSPLRADGGPTLAEIRDRLAGAMTLAEIAEVGGLLFQELSTPDPPPLSTGANGAMVATATPAPAFADASSVVPAGVGRSPWGDSSQCGLPGTSVPLNGAAMCTPRSLCNDVGGCQASPSKEGPPQCAPSTAALTDDGGLLGSPPAKNTCQGIVPAALFTPDLPPSTCDKLVTTIPIALHRETTPVMNNAAASVSTSTGGLLSLTEPTMEIQNREDPKRRDQPPCSIPPTGRGHPGVCAEPLRLDDGGCATYENTSSDAVVPAPRFSFVFDQVVWRGELVHLLQDTPGRVSRCCFNAVGQLAIAQCFPDHTPEKLSRVARLFQDPEVGSRLLPRLPIEIRRIVTASLTEPALDPCALWLKNAHMTFLPSGPADSAAFSRLFVRLQSSSAYAIIIIQTSEGPQDFALLPTLVHNKQHLIAVTPPALVDGDPCQQCPGWFRFWHDKLQRPFWYHRSEGGTWRRPDGWRGTDYPFPIIVLRRHFCDWWDTAAVERVHRTVCWNLCHRSFRHWASPVENDDACWAHLDYASDASD